MVLTSDYGQLLLNTLLRGNGSAILTFIGDVLPVFLCCSPGHLFFAVLDFISPKISNKTKCLPLLG